MKPEAKLKAKHRKYFAEKGWYVMAPVQMGLGAATLDWLCCINGKFVGIEFKHELSYPIPTPRQAQTIKAIVKAGGIAFTTNSLERTIDYLNQHALDHYNPEVG